MAERLTCSQLEHQVLRLFTPSLLPNCGEYPGRVGVELELIPVKIGEYPPRPVTVDSLTKALADDQDLVHDACISFESGGQMELSPPPGNTVASAMRHVQDLTDRLYQCGNRRGILFLNAGLNPWHTPDALGLQTDYPRYRVMQTHFDAIGGAGRRMMRQTASLQVCLDLGCGQTAVERWQLANLAGPALTAAFANSPLLDGTPTGWRSTRSAIWQHVDQSRTGFDASQVGTEMIDRYLDFALRAEAMPLPRKDEESLPFRLSFGDWLSMDGARPDAEDFAHHLTTLFPPVRPRGYLEVRYLDAVPQRWRGVPICLLAALLYDPIARRDALEILQARTRGPAREWRIAAASGMTDASLRQTACDLFDIALEAVARFPDGYLPADAPVLMQEYRMRFPTTGRCPADEQLARFKACPQDLSIWI